MKLKQIRLELARTKEFPEGNPNCGYEFVGRSRQMAISMPSVGRKIKRNARFVGSGTEPTRRHAHSWAGWSLDVLVRAGAG